MLALYSFQRTNDVRHPQAALILPGYEWFHKQPKELILDARESASRIGNYLKVSFLSSRAMRLASVCLL